MPRAGTKRKAPASSSADTGKATKKARTRRAASSHQSDSEQDSELTEARPHASAQHTLADGQRDELRTALLAWYATVHDSRTMPWRKPWDATLSAADRAQRAYEVWVSEIMLQQTQVATVVPYYTRWMERFPTVQKLAEADIEDVNALWKGLGYYTRAARLLEGAKVVVRDHNGVMPSDPAVLEKSVPGIGRYSAGAITSIAYGVCAPVLDGNVHRLLSRVLALYAPPQAKATLSLLWAAALALVTGSTSPGDVNQALIELGATICKPRAAACAECPIRASCAAYNLQSPTSSDIEDTACTLCEPLPVSGGVTRFPMPKVKKKAREETDIAYVVAWGDWVLLSRRPEKGLLGGLYEFPTVPAGSQGATARNVIAECIVPRVMARKAGDASPDDAAVCISGETHVGDILHIFSHIRKTWKVTVVHLSPAATGSDKEALPPATNSSRQCKWVRRAAVADGNLGTGTLKVWRLAQQAGGRAT